MSDATNEPEGEDAKLKPEDIALLMDAMAKAQEEAEFELPITVTEIQKKGRFVDHARMRCGSMVKIRPVVDKGVEAQTYLGIYIGDIATDVLALFAKDKEDPKSGVLKLLVGGNNPAIFVPALRRLVFGYESWWGPIDSPEDAEKMITDEAIQNVPYVKALKQMMEDVGSEEDDAEQSG